MRCGRKTARALTEKLGFALKMIMWGSTVNLRGVDWILRGRLTLHRTQGTGFLCFSQCDTLLGSHFLRHSSSERQSGHSYHLILGAQHVYTYILKINDNKYNSFRFRGWAWLHGLPGYTLCLIFRVSSITVNHSIVNFNRDNVKMFIVY